MSKVGKGGKHAMICEVCPDRLRHGMTITVGQRATGTPRFIHDRAACRKKWERDKDAIMARWPENKRAAVQAEAATPTTTPNVAAQTTAVETIKTVVLPAPAAVRQEKPMPAGKEAKRIHWKPTPELMDFIRKWVAKNGLTRSTGGEIYAALTFAKSALLLDANGNEYTRTPMVALVRAMNTVGGPQPESKPSRGVETVEDVKRRWKESDDTMMVEMERLEADAKVMRDTVGRVRGLFVLGRTITDHVWHRINEGDEETLRAVYELLRKAGNADAAKKGA
jgi:hypothetical protein